MSERANPKITSSTAFVRADLERIDAWWRAANYISVGQIYLLDNRWRSSTSSRDSSVTGARRRA